MKYSPKRMKKPRVRNELPPQKTMRSLSISYDTSLWDQKTLQATAWILSQKW
jgi:hypothetical protein